jgi:molybdenum cofactor cytidylyltransferase
MHKDLAIVILAAGASSRLGRPKQLELFKGKSLILHTIDVAHEVKPNQVITVLGANFEAIKSEISDRNTTILENEQWAKGMSTSIICGIHYVEREHPLIQKVIFMVCDQPYVNKGLLQALIDKKKETNLPIITSEYLNIKGIPTLFDKSMFGILKELTGDVGAGKKIKQNMDIVSSVPFEKGEIDIDQESDLALLD